MSKDNAARELVEILHGVPSGKCLSCWFERVGKKQARKFKRGGTPTLNGEEVALACRQCGRSSG